MAVSEYVVLKRTGDMSFDMVTDEEHPTGIYSAAHATGALRQAVKEPGGFIAIAARSWTEINAESEVEETIRFSAAAA